MNYSHTEIANSALTRMGASRIADINDITNEHARVLNGEIGLQRDKLLRQFRWRFALKRTSLVEDADAPAWGYAHAYRLPTDYLSLDLVSEAYAGLDLSDYRNSDLADYSIEDGRLLTNFGSPLPIRYVRQVTDSGLYDPHFADCLSAVLAWLCVERVKQSTAAKSQLERDMVRAIRDAVNARAIERPPQQIADDAWIVGRLG